jgi:hypothetical protein
MPVTLAACIERSTVASISSEEMVLPSKRWMEAALGKSIEGFAPHPASAKSRRIVIEQSFIFCAIRTRVG